MCGCGEQLGGTSGQADGRSAGQVVSRRSFLSAATVVGVAGAATLAPVTFAAAGEAAPQTKTITGHFDIGVPDFVYLPPVEVPRGVRQLDVSYSYDRPAVPPGVLDNALDIGIFDQRGHQLGDRAGFRGWSGGFRTSFSISNSQATPGYLPPTRAAGRGRAWYRGDCHLHTVYSEGRRLPSEVAAGARAAKLDFIVSTDHNTSSSHGV